MVLIFCKSCKRKKRAILVKYLPFTNVSQRLNLDHKNTFFPEQLLLTASVCQTVEYKID